MPSAYITVPRSRLVFKSNIKCIVQLNQVNTFSVENAWYHLVSGIFVWYSCQRSLGLNRITVARVCVRIDLTRKVLSPSKSKQKEEIDRFSNFSLENIKPGDT